MLLLLFFFGLALGSVGSQMSGGFDEPLCPTSWSNFDGRCYKYVSTHLTWAEAELFCVSQGANLVSVRSLEEHNFVKNLVKKFDHAEGPTWIGLSDLHKEGSWMWSDGCPVNFVFWNSGEPNNNFYNEHCVHNNWGRLLKWNDRLCTDRYPSVCATRKACP